MDVQYDIRTYIDNLPEPKRSEMWALHGLIQTVQPGCKLWYEDGKNSDGKTISNPNIGYGSYTIKYANGTKKDFFRIGISANTTGISVYILGIKDKAYLASTYGKTLGKASVTGYCIKFKTLTGINTDVLATAIRYGFEAGN